MRGVWNCSNHNASSMGRYCLLVDSAVDERPPCNSHKLSVSDGQLRSFSSITFVLLATFASAIVIFSASFSFLFSIVRRTYTVHHQSFCYVRHILCTDMVIPTYVTMHQTARVGSACDRLLVHYTYWINLDIGWQNAFHRLEYLPAVSHMTCGCLLYTSPSPRDGLLSRMPSSA